MRALYIQIWPEIPNVIKNDGIDSGHGGQVFGWDCYVSLTHITERMDVTLIPGLTDPKEGELIADGQPRTASNDSCCHYGIQDADYGI